MLFSRRWSTKRKVSLCTVALLALMAVGSVAAGGASAAEWEVGSQSMVGRDLPSAAVTGLGGTTTLASEFLGQAVKVSCRSTSETGNIAVGGAGSATIQFRECGVLKPATCSMASPLILEANTSPIEVAGSTYEKFVPKSESKFAEIEFLGALCPLNEDVATLKGAFAAAGPLAEPTEMKSLSLSQAINAEAGVTLQLGPQTADLSGTLTQALTYPLNGEVWRALGGVKGVENWSVSGGSLPADAAVAGGPVMINFGGIGFAISCGDAGAEGAQIISGGTETATHLVFSECSVSKPSNCALQGGSGTIRTNPVTASLSMIGGEAYEKFTPQGGGILFGLEFSGPFCALAEGGGYSVQGSFGGIGKGYGALTTTQSLEISSTSNSKTGSLLTIGSWAGSLTGALTQHLDGVNLGKVWGVY